MPELTIITPVYANTPAKVVWLGEAIASVMAQTFADWEMVIVNDASPLLLGEVKTQYLDPRLRWYDTPHNQGPAMCRNTAAELGEGEAILALDADDRLASSEVLGTMLEAWRRDKSKIIYGDLQRLVPAAGGAFELEREFRLGQYSFSRALNPSGLFPVTALHSQQCHRAAGGWKPQLEAGLEDVEKWIAAGEVGFCGLHLDLMVLHYRQHPDSRAYDLRVVNQREMEMRDLIKQLHKDSYEGRFGPMCCGNQASGVSTVQAAAVGAGAQPARMPTFGALANASAGEMTWVKYQGGRQAMFMVEGEVSKHNYTVNGTGAEFQVYTVDLPKFKRSGRGLDYQVIPPPAGAAQPQAAPAPAPASAKAFMPPAAPAPALAVLTRLDESAMRSGRQASPAQAPPAPADPGDLSFLGTPGVVLAAAGYDLLKLVDSLPSELEQYNLGPAQAARVIQEAKAHFLTARS